MASFWLILTVIWKVCQHTKRLFCIHTLTKEPAWAWKRGIGSSNDLSCKGCCLLTVCNTALASPPLPALSLMEVWGCFVSVFLFLLLCLLSPAIINSVSERQYFCIASVISQVSPYLSVTTSLCLFGSLSVSHSSSVSFFSHCPFLFVFSLTPSPSQTHRDVIDSCRFRQLGRFVDWNFVGCRAGGGQIQRHINVLNQDASSCDFKYPLLSAETLLICFALC